MCDWFHTLLFFFFFYILLIYIDIYIYHTAVFNLVIIMTVIEIPFNEWSTKRLKSGNKTATSRNKKYGRKGDVFHVENMVFEIESIEYLKLVTVTFMHYKEEGATGSQEFIDVWTGLHPKVGFIPSKKVYFHKFRRID